MQIPETSMANYFYFVTFHLWFLGKPSVWGSRPWSGPTPSPSSFSPLSSLPSSSTISWLLGGVLFPYQPPWRPDPRPRWEVLWRSSWWSDDCLYSLSPLSPRRQEKESCCSFLPSCFPSGLLPSSSSLVSQWFGSSQILHFFSWGKTPCCSFHDIRSLP